MKNNQITLDDVQTSLDDYVTVDDFIEQYSDKFTESQIKWLLRNRHHNGLQESGAVSMVSRKYYLNKPKFAHWLLSQQS